MRLRSVNNAEIIEIKGLDNVYCDTDIASTRSILAQNRHMQYSGTENVKISIR